MRTVLTLVDLPGVLDAGPDALLSVLGVLAPGDAVDVRLEGGRGPVNQQPLSDRHWRAWRDLSAHYLGGPARPSYAGLVYRLARHHELEVRGHGWVAARHIDEAIAAARRVAGYCRRYRLPRYGCNAESGIWRGGTTGIIRAGRPVYRQNGNAEALLHAWLTVIAAEADVCVDWMGYADPSWHYPGGAPVSQELARRFQRAVLMVYGDDVGAQAKRALEAWLPHYLRGDAGLLTGVGRWRDDDGDGVVDPGEVVGDPTAIRAALVETAPAEWHPYVGFGAASQLAQGHRLFPPLTTYIPETREALA